jgi:hypothetical protein
MNRNEFLKLVWRRLLRPILLLTVVLYCVRFLLAIFKENGPERMVTMVVLSLTVIFTVVGLIGEWMSKSVDGVYAKLSPSAKANLRMLAKFIDYVSLLIMGAVIYQFWTRDAMIAMILMIIVLVDRVNKILSEERTKVGNKGKRA